MRLEGRLTPLRIALAYAMFGTAALYFSDVLLFDLIGEHTLLHQLQTVKGGLEVALTAGVIYGLVTIYGRSLEHRREAVEDARDSFAFLNAVLRHHVLNRMSVVRGLASALAEAGAGGDRAETIVEQTDETVALVENVRAVAQTIGRPPVQGSIDVVPILRATVSRFESEHPRTTIETAMPGAAVVEADELLLVVVEQLVTNAIEHNDEDEPRVRILVAEGNGTVTLEVGDNGPGISPATQDGLFQRGGDDEGMGLYLVDTIVDRYDGEVSVGTSALGGAQIVVELPRAPDDG